MTHTRANTGPSTGTGQPPNDPGLAGDGPTSFRENNKERCANTSKEGEPHCKCGGTLCRELGRDGKPGGHALLLRCASKKATMATSQWAGAGLVTSNCADRGSKAMGAGQLPKGKGAQVSLKGVGVTTRGQAPL